MGHEPHVYVPGPWPTDALAVPHRTVHHLRRVLRRGDGSSLSYTDGAGRIGEGTLDGDRIRRRGEREVASPPPLTLAVAAPQATERVRTVVEKLGELGVSRLRWLLTEHSSNRIPRPERTAAWAIAALQQSRGAHLLSVDGPVGWDDLESSQLVVAAPDGADAREIIEGNRPVTIVVGPEGGFAPAEVPSVPQIALGPYVLRTETAAIVAAALALDVLRRGA